MSGRVARKLLVFDARHQLVGGRAKGWVRCKMINKRVRVKKDVVIGREVGKCHATSSSSDSISARRRPSSSLVPFHPMMPYAFKSGLSRLLTATLTRSPSFHGNGSEGLSTPFS